MQKEIKVSVVVPVYNVERYIRRCLDSLVGQTLDGVEIIAVNDASPDGSLAILREYEESYPDKVRVIDSKVNLQQGGARNLGIKAAAGRYIGFMDGDDWAEPDMYEKLFRKAEDMGADMVGCFARLVSDSGVVGMNRYYNDSMSGTLDREKHTALLIRPGHFWSKIFRRDMIQRADLWFPEKTQYEDNLWSPIITLYARSFYYIPEALHNYYQRGDSAMHTKNRDYHLNRLVTARKMVEELRTRGFYDEYSEAIEFLFTELYYKNTMYAACRMFSSPRMDMLYEVREYMRAHYPRYHANPLFKANIKWTTRLLTRINMLSPRLFVLMYDTPMRMIQKLKNGKH